MNNNTDYLTGLLGNGEFIRAGEAIVNNGDKKLAFITNDISNFKYVNDLYSMEEGYNFINQMAHFFILITQNALQHVAQAVTSSEEFLILQVAQNKKRLNE